MTARRPRLRRVLPLALILGTVIIASCGGRPAVSVSVGGKELPTVLASTTERTACSATHGDAALQNIPITSVPAANPLSLMFQAGDGTTEIRGAIYDVDAPPGGPLEEFTLLGRAGSYEPRKTLQGHTYQILVNVVWSVLLTGGEETHLARIRLEVP